MIINRRYQHRPQAERNWWLSNKDLSRKVDYDYCGPKKYHEKIHEWKLKRARAWQMDIDYPDNRHFYPKSAFKKSIDVLGSISYMHRVAIRASRNILEFLLFMYKYLKRHSLHIYKILVTGENCQIADYKGKPYYLTVDGRNPYPDVKKSWRNARRNFKKPTVFHILLDNIEATLGEHESLNVHSHALGVSAFKLSDEARCTIADRIETSFANQHEKVAVTVKPAYISKMNRNDMVLTEPVPPASVLKQDSVKNDAHVSAWQGLVNLIHYMLKQFIMPVVKGSADLQRYLRVSHDDGCIITHAIMNSASAVKSRYFYQSAKRGKKSIQTYAKKLGQQTCLDVHSVDANPQTAYYARSAFSGAVQHHHYTYEQNVARAYRIQNDQMAVREAIKAIKEASYIQYRHNSIEAVLARIHTLIGMTADHADVLAEERADEDTQKALPADSQQGDSTNQIVITANDRMRASGIPP